MKLKDINTVIDLDNYIEGILNDFEGGISDKEETNSLIADLIIYTNKLALKGKVLIEYVDDGYHCPKCNSIEVVLSSEIFIYLDCRHEWSSEIK